MSANRYNRECAESMFSKIGGTSWSSLEKFRECSGGSNEDRENQLLEEELRSQRGGGDVGEVPKAFCLLKLSLLVCLFE